MSERMTAIHLPGTPHAGYADYGRKTAAEIIKDLRAYAQKELEKATAILNAKDEDFCVETFIGLYARKKYEIIQPGKIVEKK